MKVERSELVALVCFSAFSVIWIIVVVPNLIIAAWFQSLVPPLQYIIYNSGYITLTIFLIDIPYIVMEKGSGTTLAKLVLPGLGLWLLFSFVLDMLQPPFYVATNGTMAITNAQALPNVAVDAMMTWVWIQVGVVATNMIFGVSVLFLAVYVLTPIIAIVITIIFFKPSIVWSALGIDTCKCECEGEKA